MLATDRAEGRPSLDDPSSGFGMTGWLDAGLRFRSETRVRRVCRCGRMSPAAAFQIAKWATSEP
jgi:hypothetical protein